MRTFWKRPKRYRLSLDLRDVLLLGVGALLMLIGLKLFSTARNHHTALAPTSESVSIKWLPETVARWHRPIETMAKRYDIDPDLLAIIMTMESGGYAKANSGQAQGLMQIAPATAGDIAKRYLRQPVDKYDLLKPDTSVEFGAAYLAMLRGQYGQASQGPSWNSTVELVAAAYNGGFGAANAIEKGEGLNDPQTVVYSRDAFNMWRERHAGRSPTFERWKERGGQELIDKARQEKP